MVKCQYTTWPFPLTHALLILSLTWGLGSTGSIQAHERASLPPDMAYIPFGVTIMGIDQDLLDRETRQGESRTLYQKRMSMPWSPSAFHDEGPAHWVLLESYLMDLYETSNGQYEEFMRATGHPAPAYWDDPRLNKPNHPVVGVNWYDAKAYCEWRGKRLPTEAEWEHAARGDQGFRYPWGHEFEPRRANYGKRQAFTSPVNSMPEGRSPYGLHHMAGNVFEWVHDWYDPLFCAKSTFAVRPLGPPKPIWLGGTGTYVDRLTTGAKRVIRGGSWIAERHTLTTTHRFWNHPQNNSYGVGLGFRCALSTPRHVEEELQTMTIEAMKSMGQERFDQAAEFIQRALIIDPTNEDLLRLRDLIQKRSQQSYRDNFSRNDQASNQSIDALTLTREDHHDQHPSPHMPPPILWSNGLT